MTTIVESHRVLRVVLKCKRLLRRAMHATTQEQTLRNLFLGKSPSEAHPLRFLWAIDGSYLNSWILHGEAALYLWDLLNRESPTNVLELGSGWSSLVLGKYAQHSSRARHRSVCITALESEDDWAQRSTQLLKTYDLDSHVLIRVCPLRTTTISGIAGVTYDVEMVSRETFGFALIDGPSAMVGRQLTLPSILPLVASGGTIAVDDAQRTTEHNAIDEWRRRYHDRLSFHGYVPVGNGLAIFTVL